MLFFDLSRNDAVEKRGRGTVAATPSSQSVQATPPSPEHGPTKRCVVYFARRGRRAHTLRRGVAATRGDNGMVPAQTSGFNSSTSDGG